MIELSTHVTHIFKHDEMLFGATSAETLSGDSTQIGFWRLALDS